MIELACADPENPCPLPFALGDDPPLDPVTAVTYEVGGSWMRGALSMTAAAYRTEVANDHLPGGRPRAVQHPWGGRKRRKRGGGRRPAPLVPAHTLSAGGDVQLPAGLEAGVEIRHVGRRWLRGDEANVEEPLDPYTATDLRAAWSSAGWTVRAHLGNVFQESRAACA